MCDEYVVQFIEVGRYGWAEHVMRMDKIDLAKKVLFIKLLSELTLYYVTSVPVHAMKAMGRWNYNVFSISRGNRGEEKKLLSTFVNRH